MSDIVLGIKIKSDGSARVSGDIGKINRAIAGTGAEAKKSQRDIDALGRTMQSVKNVAIGLFGISTANKLATGILETNRSMEMLRAQLTAITGSASAARHEFDFIQKFAVDTPFEINGLTKAYISLQNYGIRPTEKVMAAVTNQASKLGASQETLTGITTALGQAYAKGKLQAEEMMQLAERGVPVYDILAQALNKNTEELFDMAKNGELTRDVIGQLIDKMGEMASGSNVAAMDTLNGKISNLSDSWHRFEDTLLNDKSEGVIKGLVEDVTQLINILDRNLSDSIDAQIAHAEARIEQFNSLGAFGRFMGDFSGYDIGVEYNRLDSLKRQKARQDAANEAAEIEKQSAQAIAQTWQWLDEIDAEVSANAEKNAKKRAKAAEQAAKVAEQTAAAYANEREAISKIIEQLQYEIDISGESAETQRMLLEIRSATRNATAEEAAIITDLIQTKYDLAEADWIIAEGQRLAAQQRKEMNAEAERQAKEQASLAEKLLQEQEGQIRSVMYELNYAFDTLLFSGQSFTAALGDMFDNMIDRMLHAAVRFASDKIIQGLFSGNLGQFLGGIGVGALAIGASYLFGGAGGPDRPADSRTTTRGDDRALGFAEIVAADIQSRDYFYAQQLAQFNELNHSLKTELSVLTATGALSLDMFTDLTKSITGQLPPVLKDLTNVIETGFDKTVTAVGEVLGGPVTGADVNQAVDAVAAQQNVAALASTLTAAYEIYNLISNWSNLSKFSQITGTISAVTSAVTAGVQIAAALGASVSSTVLNAIPVVGWIVAAVINIAQSIKLWADGNVSGGLSQLITGGAGGLLADLVGFDIWDIFGPDRTPHARLKTMFSEGIFDQQYLRDHPERYGDTDFLTKVKGSSARVRIGTPLGVTTFGTFNANYSANDMVELFGDLLLLIRDTDVAVVDAINNIDAAHNQAGETLAFYYDWLQKQGGGFSPKQNLDNLEVAELLQARYEKIIDVLGESGTAAGVAFDRWFDLFTDKFGPENTLSIVQAVADNFESLMQLPAKLIDLIDNNVKSFKLGGTPEDAAQEITKVLGAYASLSLGLSGLGADINDEQIVGFLAHMNNIGFAVEEAGKSLLDYSVVLAATNQDIAAGIDELFAYAQAQQFNNAQLSSFVTSAGAYASLGHSLNLGTSNEDLKRFAEIIGSIAENTLDQAELKSLEDQASQYGGLTVSEARAEIERLGLATGDAILQITNELVFMNNALEITGSSFNKLGASLLQAIEGTQAFLEKVGGIEEWEKVVNSYFSNFFSEHEQFDYLTNQLTESLAQQNIVLPQTREAYRQLIEGLAKDLASPVAQDAYITLLQLAGQADQYYSALEAQADQAVQQAEQAAQASRQVLEDNLQAAKDMVSEAFSALQASVQREKERVNDLYNAQIDDARAAIDSLSDSVGKLRSLSDSLKSTLRNLDTPDDALTTRALAQAEIRAALAIARAGGPLPLDGQLDNALSVISQPSEDLFGSFTDYQRDFYRTANDISALNGITENELSKQVSQLDIAESQLKELQHLRDDEIERLDDILSRAQAQIDAANGTTAAVLSVKSALDGLAQALGAQSAAQQALDSATSTSVVADTTPVADVATPTVNPVINDKMIHDPGVKGTLPSVTDQQIQDFVDANVNNLQSIYEAAILYGVSSSRLAANSPWTVDQILNWTDAMGLSRFATGGISTTPAIFGDEGAEAAVPLPDGRSIPVKMSGNNNRELIEELRQLRAEIEQLRAETRAGQAAIASNTRKAAKTLDKFDIDGMPEVRA